MAAWAAFVSGVGEVGVTGSQWTGGAGLVEGSQARQGARTPTLWSLSSREGDGKAGAAEVRVPGELSLHSWVSPRLPWAQATPASPLAWGPRRQSLAGES